MTYLEFRQKWEQTILPNKENYERDGQSLINFLGVVWSAEYKRIVDTPNDCFFNSKIVPDTLKHLEQVWGNYPN